MTDLDAPATIAHLAALEFHGEPKYANITLVTLLAMARNVYKMNIIAAGLSVYDKDALVKHVAENHATVAPWLMQLHEAAKDARCIADTIEAAELRLAVALAVVEGDG